MFTSCGAREAGAPLASDFSCGRVLEGITRRSCCSATKSFITIATTMSTSLIIEAYERAQKTYKEELTEKELQKVSIPIIVQDVLDEAKKITEEHQKGKRRKTMDVFAKLESVRSRLEPFNGILEGACRVPPKVGALIWGSVNLTLQVSRRQLLYNSAFMS